MLPAMPRRALLRALPALLLPALLAPRLALAGTEGAVPAAATTAAPAGATLPDAQTVIAPIRTLCDGLIGVMKAGTKTPFDQRVAMLAPAIDKAFDLATILQVSVGFDWPNLPADQRTTLLAAFRRYTIASYVSSFDSFDGQHFVVSPTLRAVGAEQVVDTRIVATNGDTHTLDYVMRQDKAGWQAVDVLADGTISRVAVQRSDFRQLLAHGGGPALLASLQRKVADLSSG